MYDEHRLTAALRTEGREYWQYRRAFSPGLQEFIEAVSFYHFMKHGTVITRQEVEELIRSGSPNVLHFLATSSCPASLTPVFL